MIRKTQQKGQENLPRFVNRAGKMDTMVIFKRKGKGRDKAAVCNEDRNGLWQEDRMFWLSVYVSLLSALAVSHCASNIKKGTAAQDRQGGAKKILPNLNEFTFQVKAR